MKAEEPSGNVLMLKRDDDSVDFVALLKAGTCHYVSVAMPGLTVACAAIEFAGGFDVRQRNDFLMRVNHGKETGTLFPRVNITLLPSSRASYGGLDLTTHHEGGYAREDVIVQILDAFKANAEHIKSGEMYFDFRDVVPSERYYAACLKAAVERAAASCLPEIITWEPK